MKILIIAGSDTENSMRKFIIIVSLLHIVLTLSDMIIYRYNQSADSPRYIVAANEFSTFDFKHLTPEVHSNTAPGYPIFLALIKIFTHQNKFLIAIFQSILFCTALYYFLNNLFQSGYITELVLKLSFFLTLISPEIFQTNETAMTESLCASMMLLMAGSLFSRNKSTWIFALSSTLLVLTKFEYIFIVAPLFIYLLWGKQYRPVIISIVILFTCLTLNGYKNLLTFGKFNPTSFGSGTVIYGGNNLNGDGSFHMWWVTKNYVPKENINELQTADILKQDSILKSLAFQSWKNPIQQLKTIPVKLGKLWLIPASMDFYTGQTEIKKGMQIGSLFDDSLWPWYGKYKHGFYLGIYWIFLIGILIGFTQKIRQGLDSYDKLVIFFFIAVSIIYGVFFYGLGRFHVPMLPFMIVYFAWLIKNIYLKIILADD